MIKRLISIAFVLLTPLFGTLPAAYGDTRGSVAADTLRAGSGRQWLPPFTAVEVTAGIDLRFVRIADSETPKIDYDTKGSYTTKFRAEVRDGVLRISERRDSRRSDRTSVTVYYTDLRRLSLQEASVTFSGPLETSLLDLSLGGSAQLKCTLSVSDLVMDLSGTNTVATLDGTVRYLRVYASGGRVGASALTVMSAEVNATGSSRVVLHVTDRLEAKTSTGGVVTYKGDPEVLRTDEKFMGGSIARTE